jgi:hypothetical protein
VSAGTGLDARQGATLNHGAIMTDRRSAGNWRLVTASSPCPICKKPDWCSISADGALVSCRREENGALKIKADKAGGTVYLHRLAGDARADVLPPSKRPGPESPRLDADTVHRAYSALLARLELFAAHRTALRQRGLADAEIDRRGYRTLPINGRARRAAAIRLELGDALLTVPGFYLKPGNNGRPYLTIAGAAGLLVPIRDLAGRIVALTARRDDASDGKGKYSYLSSAKHGGPGPGSPPHVPLGVTGPCQTCRLTEGALKADIAAALSGVPTIGAAGVGTWQPALDAMRELGCKTVRMAFDADALDNPHVGRALAACCEAAAAGGLAVEMERWDKAAGKGIDDLLAAGKAPELLLGEAVQAAVGETLAAATAGAALPPPDVLDGLADRLAAEGATGLFRDKAMLQALAALSVDDPPEYARRRVALREAGVKMRDFDRAIRRAITEETKRRPPQTARGETGGFFVKDGCICRTKLTLDGPLTVGLCNFTAEITDETIHDDGAERRVMLGIAGQLAGGRTLPRVEVSAEAFSRLEWVVPSWGSDAITWPGEARALPPAIQALSQQNKQRRTVYGHTGWRRIADSWCYLHGAGAIGPDGTVHGIDVELPSVLADFTLPEPPTGEALAFAVRASLALLDGLTADRLAFPLCAAVWRAALGDAPGPIDFCLHLSGQHGVNKSELAALVQQHFGAGLNARHLPGSWSSTANATEALAFVAKDALLVVDDYAPRGAAGDRQRLERDADRLLRAQGNRAGRQRMRADGGLRPVKPPRGLILSTGEDVPPGQSLRGRMLVLEISPADAPKAKLTPHQRAAAEGRYAETLAGFLTWLAPQYADLCARLPGERFELRERAQTGTGSARTPGIVADLALGLQLFLEFALVIGAIGQAERDDLTRRIWQALAVASAGQAEHIQATEPTALFVNLLAAAVTSGRGHVAGPDGDAPIAPAAWGWRREDARDGPIWRPQGRRIGWIDGADLFLEPEAAYAEAQDLARVQGDGLPVSAQTLRKRLKEKGLLVTTDEHRQKLTVRKTFQGSRRDVLHLSADCLASPPETGPTGPQCDNAPENGPVLRAGFLAGTREPAHKLAQKNGQHDELGRLGRFETGGEASLRDNGAAKRRGTL